MSKSKIKVSFTIEVDDDSELGETLEYLDSRKLMSRLKQKIVDHVTEECRKNPYYLDDKNIDVVFEYGTDDERLSIINNLKDYVSNEDNFKINNPNAIDDGY